MSSRPLPSTMRPSHAQFVGDLAQIFRRHKIPCGHPSDIEHLASDLVSNPSFRGDLFSLCTAISHMSEHDLSPTELLELVTCAVTGTRTQPRIADLPPGTAAAFVEGYKAWSDRIAGVDIREPALDEEPAWKPKSNPFSAAASLAASSSPASQHELKVVPPPAQIAAPGSLPPDTPIGNLTVGELKNYLDEIEQQVSRLRPYLDSVTKSTPQSWEASSSPDPVPAKPQHAAEPLLFRRTPQRALEAKPEALPPEEGDTEQAAPESTPAPGIEPAPEASPPIQESAPHKRVQIFKGLKPVSTSFQFAEPAPPSPPPPRRVEPGPFVSYAHPVIIPMRSGPKDAAKPSSVLLALIAFAVIGAATFLGMRALDRVPFDTVAPSQPAQSAPIAAPPAPTELVVAPPSRAKQPRSAQSPRFSPATPTSPAAADVATVPVPSSSSTAAAAKPFLISGSAPAPVAVPAPGSRQPAPGIPNPAVAPASSRPGVSGLDSAQGQATRPALDQQSVQRSPTEPSPSIPNSTAPTSSAHPAPVVRTPQPPNQPVNVPSPTLMQYAVATPAPTYPVFHQPVLDSSVIVQVTIGKDGHVISARALAGSSELGGAAVQAIEKWRFRPYLVDGAPVEVVTNVKFVFKAQ